MMLTSEKQYPDSLDELLKECESLIKCYDLYALGQPKTAEEASEWPSWPDGTEVSAGEYQYGVAMIPAQWVTHVLRGR